VVEEEEAAGLIEEDGEEDTNTPLFIKPTSGAAAPIELVKTKTS